jgi:hypothetical protein
MNLSDYLKKLESTGFDTEITQAATSNQKVRVRLKTTYQSRLLTALRDYLNKPETKLRFQLLLSRFYR